MPDKTQVDEIVTNVRAMFSAARSRDIHLRLAGQQLDDDWLYLVAEPTRAGEDASDHARFMTEVERALRKDGFDQVLLVPALPDYDGLVDAPDTGEKASSPAA